MHRDVGVRYVTNGSGRDTYIYNDNGGFNFMKRPRDQFHPGSIPMKSTNMYRKEKSPPAHSRAIVYKTDGSGRDGYINSNSGGMRNHDFRNQEFRAAFKKSLRTWDRDPYYLQRRGINGIYHNRSNSKLEQSPRDRSPHQSLPRSISVENKKLNLNSQDFN